MLCLGWRGSKTHVMHLEYVIIALFTVATAVALIARRFRVPYTVALVVTGLVLGSAHALEPP